MGLFRQDETSHCKAASASQLNLSGLPGRDFNGRCPILRPHDHRPRLDLVKMSDSTVIPWVAAHISHVSLEQELDTQTVSLSALSWAATGGVDLRVGDKGFIQIAYRRYPFTSDLKVGSATPERDLKSTLRVMSVTYVAHTW